MYKLIGNDFNQKPINGVKRLSDNAFIPFDHDNTDYQAFKSFVLNQELGNLVAEDGDSFSLNTSPNDSILEDADGNVMTIDQAKEYVRTLP